MWCQGFSEPGSGSDLASLRTRAVRDGDHYVVTGQKIWCSYGQIGDVGELLVRTDPDAPKHKGISWLMLPMDLPGIEVRPLKTVLGSSEFCELFLDEVRVPVECRVGAENDGWRVTNVTLSFERGTAFVSDLVDTTRLVEELAPYVSDPGHRRELGHIAAELDALWALTKRNVTQSASGRQGRGPFLIKLAYTEVCQKLGELALRVLDRDALTVDGEGPFVEERLRSLAFTIAAGTSQIQRNIIGERVLGLPGAAVSETYAYRRARRAGPERSAGAELMAFDLTDDQLALRDGIRALVEGRFPIARVREGFDASMHAELADAGVFSLLADGFTWTDAVVVYEELGRGVIPGPLVASFGRDAITTAFDAAGARCAVRRARRHRRPTWCASAPTTAARARDRRSRRSATPRSGPSIRSRRCGASTRSRPRPAAPTDASAELRREGALLTAAYCVGMADRLTELAVDYAQERKQFDRPIGSFQARQAHPRRHGGAHRARPRERPRGGVRARRSRRPATLDRALSGAKLLAGEAAVLNGRSATQVYGGMGFTWEVDVHLYLKRAWLLETHFGGGDHHADAVAAIDGQAAATP